VKKYQILFCFILVFLTTKSFAQSGDDCILTLKEAEKLYEAGKLEEISALLEPCIKSGFNKEQKTQAYRLLTLSYLFDNQNENAEKAILKLLKYNPEYQINTAIDPSEFINLYNNFRTVPVFTIGIDGGLNLSKPSVYQYYGVDNMNNLKAGYYTQASYQVGLNFSKSLSDNIRVNLNPNMNGVKIFKGSTQTFNSYENSVDTLSSFGGAAFKENQNWLSIPLSFTYDFNISPKYKPYIRLGATAGILISAKSEFERLYQTKAGLPNISGQSVDVFLERNNHNFWLLGGVGLKYKIPMGNLFIDIQYNHGLRNINNPSMRYNNTDLLYRYFHIDDDFTLNRVLFSLGYARYIYKPKKK
jgi:hypothetical protein